MRVRAGEVIGLYGLIGAGRSEFVQSIFGRFPENRRADFLEGQAGVRFQAGKRCHRTRHRAGAGEPPRSGTLS